MELLSRLYLGKLVTLDKLRRSVEIHVFSFSTFVFILYYFFKSSNLTFVLCEKKLLMKNSCFIQCCTFSYYFICLFTSCICMPFMFIALFICLFSSYQVFLLTFVLKMGDILYIQYVHLLHKDVSVVCMTSLFHNMHTLGRSIA